jgi:hypothetical protein
MSCLIKTSYRNREPHVFSPQIPGLIVIYIIIPSHICCAFFWFNWFSNYILRIFTDYTIEANPGTVSTRWFTNFLEPSLPGPNTPLMDFSETFKVMMIL